MPEQIALGLGDNVDYEIAWDSQVIEDLIIRHNIHAAELSTQQPIRTERDLVISILGFLQSGTGGERHVAESALVEEFAREFAMKVTLGGTSVRAAIAMRKLGYTSALHLVTINDHVRRLIPQDSPYVCSNEQDSQYPHLIVQFDSGARICAGDIDLTAPRANRIIYHDDTDNVAMHLSEDFGGLIAGAQVFLVSGFNAMRSRELLSERLATLRRIMAQLPAGAQVFFEDAGYYDPSFHPLIREALGARIDIFSLNEDELQGHLGRSVGMLDPRAVAAALEELHALIPAPVLVVHSMHWALAYMAGASPTLLSRPHGTANGRIARALKGGVTMATTRFRYGDDFSVENYRAVDTLPPNPQGAAFCEGMQALLGPLVCCVPVAQVEQANATTIGLGDAFVGGFLPALL
jgi:ADP-dependent phosphofructokinase/glucokinase